MLENIKGIGQKTIKILNSMNIYSINDLVEFYPYRYEVLKRTDLSNIKNGNKVILDGIVESIPTIYFYGKKKNVMSFKMKINNILFSIKIYNRSFLKNKIKIGDVITIIGKIDNGKIICSDIKLNKLSDIPKIEVIYHLKNGISNNDLSKFINDAFDFYSGVWLLPSNIKEKFKNVSKKEALKELHRPTSSSKFKACVNMLKYEELFIFMTKINNLKLKNKSAIGFKKTIDYKKIVNIMSTLPFELTKDQKISVDAIYKDMISRKRMNRLIQGDVGSGKTVVAFLSLYMNYLAGFQGVLMAPTEVLSRQHYESIKKYFDNVNVEILLGSTLKRDRKNIIKQLEAGNIDILIGTHALFSDDVIYNNLGLVITDEQHRFGVNQRNLLKNKGVTPDVLYLSATPIPRTYALTIYGDMDISNIHTLPSGKKDIITMLKTNDEIKDVLNLMYQEIKNGHQVYVIAPLVEESDKIDLESVNEIYDKMNRAFSKVCKIGLMHGKLSPKEKENVMNNFSLGNTKILVSTTVIEVGVDVKNATMIVIFDSNRFGLSTLHQLRGRVGRNKYQSYCILISDDEKERLKIMAETCDGFKISEEDFKLRGSGDLFGTRQSGEMSFKLADIKRDFKLLLQAKEDSLRFLEKKKDTEENVLLNKIINNSVNID